MLLMVFKACPWPGFGEEELKADHLLAPLKGPSMASCEIGDEAFARAPQKPFNRAQGSYLPPPRYIDNLTHAVFTGGSVPDYLTEAKPVKRRENDTFSSQPSAPSTMTSHICGHCQHPDATNRCSGYCSQIVWYCSAAYQKEAWSDHKGSCRKTKKEKQLAESDAGSILAQLAATASSREDNNRSLYNSCVTGDENKVRQILLEAGWTSIMPN